MRIEITVEIEGGKKLIRAELETTQIKEADITPNGGEAEGIPLDRVLEFIEKVTRGME